MNGRQEERVVFVRTRTVCEEGDRESSSSKVEEERRSWLGLAPESVISRRTRTPLAAAAKASDDPQSEHDLFPTQTCNTR